MHDKKPRYVIGNTGIIESSEPVLSEQKPKKLDEKTEAAKKDFHQRLSKMKARDKNARPKA